MRIAIDATPVVANMKGIGAVAEGLVSAASGESALGKALIFVDQSFAAEAARAWPGRNLLPVNIGSSLVWETIGIRRLLARNRIDLLVTLRERTIVPRHVRSLVWLFEIPDHRVALLLGSDATMYQKLVARHSVARFARVAKRTNRFVVSSEFTRNDLIDRYRIAADRIAVVHPGVAQSFSSRVDETGSRGKRYVLHFATGDLRENSSNAIRAFASAANRIPADVVLVLAGVPDSERPVLAALIAELGLTARTEMRGYIEAADMPALFAGADLYLDPTLVEGFGLQLVEAMTVGTCVIASTTSSVPEIVGDAGVLVAPDDVGGMSDAIVEVLNDSGKRRAFEEAGKQRASRYSWARAASELNGVVEKLAVAR